jgi:ParB family chromosome partitioning protein
MARVLQSEAFRGNTAESLARRPTSAGGFGADAQARQFEGRKKLNGACEIATNRIIPDSNQPRTEFDQDALDRLAASLKARGQLQPIRVRWSDEADRYVLVVGERRWRAAQLAGLESLACVVVQGDVSPEDLLEDQLVENAIREGLKPVEQARAYRALMDARGLTHRDLAERLHVHHTAVTQALGMLDLPGPIQAAVDAGQIAPSTAYELGKVADPIEQAELAEDAAAGRLKRDELRERVAASKPKASRPRAGASKGRGAKAKPKLPTSRVIRTAAGPRLTVEYRKGLDVTLIEACLEQALATVRAERGDDQAAA